MLRFPLLALGAALVLLTGCDATNVQSPIEPAPPNSDGVITPGLLANAPSDDALFQITVVDENDVPVPGLLVMLRSDLDLDTLATARYEDGVPGFEVEAVAASPAEATSGVPATVTYTLESAKTVSLFLKDREGRVLTQFFEGEQAAGTHSVAIPFALFDAATPDALVTPGGLYLVEVDADGVKAEVPAVYTECPFSRAQPEVWGWLGTTDADGVFVTDDQARFPSSYGSNPLLELRDAAGDYNGTFTFETPVTIVVKDDAGNEATYTTTIDPDAVNFFEAVWNP